MNVMLALDSAMGIFNNVPPRVNYCELDLQLSCHIETFELTSYAEMVQRSAFPRGRMKLIDAFQKLFVQSSEVKAAYQHEVLCCWDMLLLIHGACVRIISGWYIQDANSHPVLFTHCWQHLFGNPLHRASPTSLTAEPQLVYDPMKTALANWKILWDDIRAKLPRTTVGEMGFETSADSYWTLVRMIVLKFEYKKRTTSVASSTNGTAGQHAPHNIAKRDPGASDDGMSESSLNSRGARGISPSLDFMPLEADCDSQGAHLRKILSR